MRRRDFIASGAAFASMGCSAAAAAVVPAVQAFEAQSGGHFGFYAENTQDGRKLAWRADDRFLMCSSFKASLAALILRHVDEGRESLSEEIALKPGDMQDWYAPVATANLSKGFMTVDAMCAAAVEHSDNTCASLLLARVGGPAAITAFWRSLGDRESRLDDPEPFLNRTPLGGVRDTTTPRAMAETFGKLTLGEVLTPSSRNILNGWLVANTTGDDRLRAGLPKAWVTGDKTGNNGADAAIDLAVTWGPRAPIVIAAFTRGGSPTAAQFQAVFRAVGELAARQLA